MVRPAGLEPARPKATNFKSAVSTNSTMGAVISNVIGYCPKAEPPQALNDLADQVRIVWGY